MIVVVFSVLVLSETLAVMAVLGLQLVFTMIMVSCLSKFSAHMSFGRWLLCCGRLARYVHPSDDELRRIAGVSASSVGRSAKNGKQRSDRRTAGSDDQLTLSKSADIQLDMVPIRPPDLLPLRFYAEFQWLMDFAVCGVITYSLTEAYYAFGRPLQSEVNLSMMWCLLIIAFAVKTLFSVTAIYFRTDEGGERILCIVFGLFFLVVAMAVLITPDTVLDFGFEVAYTDFTAAVDSFFEKQGLESAGPVSLMTVRILLALVCSLFGALVTFPGLRLARMHTDAMRHAHEQPIKQLLLLINMILPLVAALAWVRPLAREPLARYGVVDESFELVRIAVVLFVCVVRTSMVRAHLQAHLNMAHDRVVALRREPGRISTTELQKLVVRVYYYLCVVALQYLAPVVILLFTVLMLKTLSDVSVLRVLGYNVTLTTPTARADQSSSAVTLQSYFYEVYSTAVQFSQILTSLRQIFVPSCFRCLLSFTSWWLCATCFLTSSFGLIYYSYFDT